MKAIKGFDKDLKCRGFQYQVGETYRQDDPAELCRTGFHAVLQPIDVLRYYPPATSVYHEVELEDVVGPEDEDSKIAGREISIGARIELPRPHQGADRFRVQEREEAREGRHIEGCPRPRLR